ncbi:MAG: GNAT family N-acetyltransferase [Candidatus Yanofskybacteria bacterium]|nr:GNAT family N-acetyltransferase [Candidatus Yanofskybacteria bacterium]
MSFKNKKLKFVGERIFLRTLGVDDATEEYAGWLNDPEVNRFLATKSATVDELRNYIIKKDEQDDALFFGIFLKDPVRGLARDEVASPKDLGEATSNGTHIGTIKLEPIDLAGKKATIAMMIGNKNYWGKGLMPEATKLLINYCFSELGLDEVNLGVLDQNKSAIRAYEKVGFKETHRAPKSVNYSGQVYDHVFMALRRKG